MYSYSYIIIYNSAAILVIFLVLIRTHNNYDVGEKLVTLNFSIKVLNDGMKFKAMYVAITS